MSSLLARPTVRRLVVVAGLSVVAFTAPLLDLYGRNPEVFVANRTNAGQIVLFGIGVALLVPLVCWAILAIANAVGERTASITYRVLVALLALGTGLVVSRQVFPESTPMALLLTLAIAGFVFWVVRVLDTLFIVAAVAVPVLMVVFLGPSATAGLIWAEPEEVEAATDVGNPSNVVMIQLDEFPQASIVDVDGTVNEALFPNFARLAETGTWYRNAFSTSIATTQSVPAILTGRLGQDGLSPSYVDHPDNLFTLLGDSYEMHVIEWVAEMCPEEICPDYAGRAPARFSSLLKDVGVVYGHLTLPAVLRDRLPSIDNSWKGFLGQTDTPAGTGVDVPGLPVPPDPTRARWVNWVQRLVNGIEADTPPTLSYTHIEAPHVPWVLNPSGTHYVRPEEYTEVEGVEGSGRWGPNPDAALLGFQRHLFQLGFLDKLIGRLLDHITETGTWDDTMIVVIADHGASFVPGEHRRWPYEDNRDDLYRVPLFIKYPGQTSGSTVDIAAFGTDVLPTIVDALDIDTDWEFDGESLLEFTGDRPHEPLHWCCNSTGVSTDLEVLFDQVERNHGWVPDQTSWLGVAAVGPYADLVGSTIEDLEVETASGLLWSLDLGSDLGDVDVSSGVVQTLVTGRLEGADLSGVDDVLVVLNDVVAGVAYVTRDSASGGSFTGIVAEELVRDGPNDVELLVPDGGGRWLAGESSELTVELVADDGHVLDIGVEGSRRVQVDRVTPTDNGWELRGWAADVTKKLIPDTIYVYAGTNLLYHGPPNTENKNVVRWFGSDDLLESGFEIDISGTDVPDGVDQLLVVAEFGDGAVSDGATLVTG